MPVLTSRKRMVSLRLSDEEYQKLVSLCAAYEAHSTSDMARTAIRKFLSQHGAWPAARKVNEAELYEKISQLEDEIRRLDRAIHGRAMSASASEG